MPTAQASPFPPIPAAEAVVLVAGLLVLGALRYVSRRAPWRALFALELPPWLARIRADAGGPAGLSQPSPGAPTVEPALTKGDFHVEVPVDLTVHNAARVGSDTAALPLPAEMVRARLSRPGGLGLFDVMIPIVVFLLGGGLLAQWLGTPPPASSAALDRPARHSVRGPGDIAAVAGAQAITLAVVLLLAGWAVGLRGLGLRVDRLGRDTTWGLIGYLAAWPLVFAGAYGMQVLVQWLRPGAPPQHPAIEFLMQEGAPRSAVVLAVFSAAVLAPVLEECYFRGLLLGAVSQATGSAWIGVLISSLAFGLIHQDVWHHMPALTLLGVVLGWVYLRSRSLTASILLHATFNAKTLIFLFCGAAG